MSILMLLIGFILAIAVLATLPRINNNTLRGLVSLSALLIFLAFFALSSIRYISAAEVGIVTKHLFGSNMTGTGFIATNGEKGIQADVLPPGWHLGYWPVAYDVLSVPLTDIKEGQIGIIEAKDGKPLPAGQVIGPEFPAAAFQQMLDARYFLSTGGGCKGTQASVLTTGKYRLNTELFKIKMVPVTEVVQGEVAVLKANFGKAPSVAAPQAEPPSPDRAGEQLLLAGPGEMGIRADILPPGKYPLNTDAYTVTQIWTTQMVAQYTAAASGMLGTSPSGEATFVPNRKRNEQQQAQQNQNRPAHEPSLEERAITVRTSDGFTFPVDVRVEYVVEPRHAPIVVARLGDDEGERFRNIMNSSVRAIFRNNAENVRALDYVQQRSHQETQSLTMLKEQLAHYGVTVTAVRIGNVGDEQTLGTLLKTQTDREIAKQEQLTFQEQEKAAAQKKQLSRATQEADEEKRLATAAYAAKIAEETKKQKITEATAEAESITIKAKAQADAFRLVAEQIGKGNAALIEVLKIVGERGIQIAPRVMVTGGPGSTGHDNQTTALIGTMLDTMTPKDEPAAVKPVSTQK